MPYKAISHAQRQRKQYDKKRKHQDNFTSCTRWRKMRKLYLEKHPICDECRETGATEVHHIKPRHTHPELIWDWNNFQGLCKSCHSRETAKEVLDNVN